MPNLNQVIIAGHLGGDPEIRYLESGQAVCNLSVATSEKFTTKAGEKRDETTWHRVAVWGKQAENCAKYLAKGRAVFVIGKLKTRKYEKDGQTHYATDIVASNVQFLGGGRGDGKKGGDPVADALDVFDGAKQTDEEIPF